MRHLAFLGLILCLASSASLAVTGVQTDWSGGPGVLGPVTDFGSDFYAESGIEWSQSPGLTSLIVGIVEHQVEQGFDGGHSVHVSDVDGDGDADILGAAYNDGVFAWWENADGIGGEWMQHVIADGYYMPWSIYGGDIDGDGDCDAAGAVYGEGTVIWWENTDGSGTNWDESVILTSYAGASAVYAVDIDDDGDSDVLATAREGDQISWLENEDGSGQTWTLHTLQYGFDGARSVYAGDIDGDGDIDVIGAAVIADDIAWWENVDGAGQSWTKRTITGSFDGACCVYAGDIDGDGDLDVLGAGVYASSIRWWENLDGVGQSWAAHNVDTSLGGAHSVMSADLDGDGDQDVIGTAENDDDVTWWENADGSGLNWIEHILNGSFVGAEWAWTGDFDSDGFLDVTAICEYGNEVSWWDLAYGSGSLESSILDTGDDPDWDFLEWSSYTPAGATLGVQVRASDDHTAMGSWSDILFTPCPLAGIIDDGDRYFQYRVVMEATGLDSVPQLFNIEVTWDPTGIGGSEPPATGLLPFAPNPSRGSVTVSFSLSGSQVVSMTVFDLSGREVTRIEGEYGQGLHQLMLGEIPPGVYFCRFETAGCLSTRRFAVVD
jgi:hypothetical protein